MTVRGGWDAGSRTRRTTTREIPQLPSPSTSFGESEEGNLVLGMGTSRSRSPLEACASEEKLPDLRC